MGAVRCGGAFADVLDGEYSGRSVAIKRFRTSECNSDKVFKVLLIDLTSHRCSFLSVVMSRDYRLETLVTSEYLTSAGCFCVCGPILPQHHHRVDAQWERGAVHKVQSKGEPPTTGETTHCSRDLSLIRLSLLAFRGYGRRGISPWAQDRSWRSQGGENRALEMPFISLTSEAEKHPG